MRGYQGSQRVPMDYQQYHRQPGSMITTQGGLQSHQVNDALAARTQRAKQLAALQQEAMLRKYGTTDPSQLPPWAMNAEYMH